MPSQMPMHLPVSLPAKAQPVASIPAPPQPVTAAFPAYNQVAKTTPIEVSIKSESTTSNTGLKILVSKTRIICPDENVSLVRSSSVV